MLEILWVVSLAACPFFGLAASWFLGLLDAEWYPVVTVARVERKPTVDAVLVTAEAWFGQSLRGGYVWKLRG